MEEDEPAADPGHHEGLFPLLSLETDAQAMEDSTPMSVAIEMLKDSVRELKEMPNVMDLVCCPHMLYWRYFGFSPICMACKSALKANEQRKTFLFTSLMSVVYNLDLKIKTDQEHATGVDARAEGTINKYLTFI